MVYEQYRVAQKRLNISFNKYELWQKTAKVLNLSKEALRRLEWIIYYYEKADQNTSLTCRHFHIYRSQWYYWFKRFDETNLRTLEDESRAPNHTRQKEYTPLQYERMVKLRRQYIRYGKTKLFKLYQKLYPSDITMSEWKAQCIIQRAGIYYHAQKQAKINRKRQKSQKKKRITELKKKPKTGFLIWNKRDQSFEELFLRMLH